MGTVALVLAAVVAVVVTWRRRRLRAASRIALGLGAWLLAYGAVLVIVSLASEERVLAPGETKWFCGVYIDCHMGVAIRGVRTTDLAGSGPGAIRPSGRFWIVTLAVENSAIRVPLRLYAPRALVIDSTGRSWKRALSAEYALEGRSADLTRRVPPGSAYTVDLVFDLPEDVTAARLFVAERGMPDRLAELVLIGDEDSLLHAPTTLRISRAAS